MATKIFVAAGHGGDDPGATSARGNERDFLEPLVDRAVAMARPHLATGHEIVVVPHSHKYRETVGYFNAKAGPMDILMDVHLNSNAGTPGTGTEVYYGLKPFAVTVQDALVKVLGLSNRGAKYTDAFYVTNAAVSGGEKSGIIVEMGFINNNHDMDVLSDRGDRALATAIVSASYGKYTPFPNTTPPSTTPQEPKPTYKVVKDGKQIGAYTVEKNAYNSYKNNAAQSITLNGKDVSAEIVAKYDPKPTPQPSDKDKEQDTIIAEVNNRLSAVEKVVAAIVSFLETVFKGFKK